MIIVIFLYKFVNKIYYLSRFGELRVQFSGRMFIWYFEFFYYSCYNDNYK